MLAEEVVMKVDVKGNGELWEITNVEVVSVEGMLITLKITIQVDKPNFAGGYTKEVYRQISVIH